MSNKPGPPQGKSAPPLYRGSLDRIRKDFLEGWICQTDRPSAVEVHVLVDGKEAGRLVASHYRGDLYRAGVGEGAHGFQWKIPARFYDGQIHTFEIETVADHWRLPQRLNKELLFGELGLRGIRAVAGWFRESEGAASEVRLFIDGLLAGQSLPGPQGTFRSGKSMTNFAISIPRHWLDDQEHEIRAEVAMASQVRSLGPIREVLWSRGDLAVGQVTGLQGNAIEGFVFAPHSSGHAREVSLLVNGVEEMRARVDARGRFSLSVATLPVLEWIGSKVELISLRDRAALRYDGRHIIADAISVVIADSTQIETLSVSVYSEVSLSGGFELEAYAGKEKVGAVQVPEPAEETKAEVQLRLSKSGSDVAALSFAINGAPIRRSAPEAGEVLPPRDLSGDSPKPVFIPGDDLAVRNRLQELALGNVQEPRDSDPPAISGAWRFVPPDRVEGWAVNMTSPGDQLAVTLYLGGRPVQSRLAREMTQPAEAQVDFQVPVGFTFVLAHLPHFPSQLEVRPSRGGSLAPHRPRLIRFEARESLDALSSGMVNRMRDAIDQHVAAGRLTEAYLLARRYPAAASIAARHLVLDFALRTEWHTYGETLARWEAERHGGPFLDYFKSVWRVRTGEVAEIAHEDELLELPPSYAPLFRVGERDDAAGDLLPRIEKHLRWRALVAAGDVDSSWPAPGDAALLYLLKEDDLSEVFSRHLTDAIERGIAVVVFLDQIEKQTEMVARLAAAGASVHGAEDFRAAAAKVFSVVDGRKLLFVSRRPAIYGVEALCLWPGVLDQKSATLTIAEVSQPVDLAVMGRENDTRTTVLRKPTEESLVWMLQGDETAWVEVDCRGELEVAAYQFSPRVATDITLIVLHDFELEAQLPFLPSAALAFRLHPTYVVMDGRNVSPAELEETLMARYDAKDQTPVAFLSRDLSYPRDYLQECLRLSRRHRGKVRLSLLALDYKGTFSLADPRQREGLSFFALIPVCCFMLRDLGEVWNCFAAGERLILSRDRPLLAIPLLNRSEATCRTLKPICAELDLSASARQKGFVGAALAKRSIVISSLPGSALHLISAEAEGKSALISSAAAVLEYPSAFEFAVEDLEQLLALDRRDLAEGLLLKSVVAENIIRNATRDQIENILRGAKLLGLQEAVGAQLQLRAEALVDRDPAIFQPLFELLAVALSEADFTTLLFSGIRTLATRTEGRSLSQAADLCRKYCPSGTFLTLLLLIDSLPQNSALSEKRFASLAGEALDDGVIAPFVLPRSGLDLNFFLRSVPLERRLLQALASRDRFNFIDLGDRLLASGRNGTTSLLRTLRMYTAEVSELKVGLAEMAAAALLNTRDRLILASILGDRAYVAQCLDGVGETSDDAAIVAASCIDQCGLLEQNYQRWAAAAGVTPMSFRGDSVGSMFKNFAQAELPAPVEGANSKVSVIMTVHNPDLELLRLAILSMLRQTHSNFELLLLDDASEEVGVAAIEALAAMDERILFLRLPRNQGPYVGRNRALEICQGTCIAIQDGDDYSHPQRLERQLVLLHRNPFLQYCTASHLRIDRKAHLQFEHTLGLRGDGVMSSMFRRSVIDRLGPFVSVRSRGDVEFRERIRSSYGEHAIAHIECPLIFCYATPQSLSNRTARNFTHFLSLFRESFQLIRRDPVIPGEDRPPPRPVVVPWPLRP